MEKNKMKYLTIQQTKDLINKRPAGVEPKEILDGLTARGYTIQGLNENKPAEATGGLHGVGVGIAKGLLSTFKGAGQLGEKIGQGVLGGVEKITGLPVTSPSVYSEEALQASADKGGLGKLLTKETLEPKGKAEKIGKFGEQVAEFAIPATKVTKAFKGASILGKTISRAITSGTVATIQAGDIGKETAIAVGVEAALPVVGKILTPVKNIVSRLFKNLGSGLSGANREILTTIVENPNKAVDVKLKLLIEGDSGILKRNAETIINGVSQIKREARQAFGTGLEALKATDIDNKVFKTSTQTILDKYGSILKGGKRELTNVEFTDPKNIKVANELLNKLHTAKLDGKSLRKLADDIEAKAFKIATSDERLSFNVFVKDLASALKNTISKSTTKLDEINKAFSKDIGLAQSIEDIFGKVKFKNASEINKVSQKLETLFQKKGLSPEYIDSFLTRIGIKPADFKTTEAIRQISKLERVSNSEGFSFSELLRGITSAIVPPERVRDIAIITGKTIPVIKQLMEKTAPSARAVLIESLIPNN